MNTERAHRKIDWISDRWYEMGIMRFGRTSFPASWLVLPYGIATFVFFACGLGVALSGEGPWWMGVAFLVMVGVPLLIWLRYGAVSAYRRFRNNQVKHLDRARARYESNVRGE